ncbi:MAG TPA: MBL fold metallo-hydrolase [Pseudonocardiaceae bacterium]|jgi:glyoxylase-like metal-dependent hydrolase (beta-lactamase superfamily II)|nr:MBL fold metallo-hydrolase [Pseudonocardiaceae bacterium]
MAARIDRVVTSGTFRLDGEAVPVENNVWLLGDDDQVMVIDAAHDSGPIRAAIGNRRLFGVACTHGHNDHIDQAPVIADEFGGPTMLHPADLELWHQTHGEDSVADEDLVGGQELRFAGVVVRVLHTPGHTPGSVSLYVPALETVFSGDTLFPGGPGRTGQSFSDYDLIIRSIQDELMSLPPATKVLPGHGDSTTIEKEAPYIRGLTGGY